MSVVYYTSERLVEAGQYADIARYSGSAQAWARVTARFQPE